MKESSFLNLKLNNDNYSNYHYRELQQQQQQQLVLKEHDLLNRKLHHYNCK